MAAQLLNGSRSGSDSSDSANLDLAVFFAPRDPRGLLLSSSKGFRAMTSSSSSSSCSASSVGLDAGLAIWKRTGLEFCGTGIVYWKCVPTPNWRRFQYTGGLISRDSGSGWSKTHVKPLSSTNKGFEQCWIASNPCPLRIAHLRQEMHPHHPDHISQCHFSCQIHRSDFFINGNHTNKLNHEH